jgi:endo-1,4-beta-xylanase
LFKIYHAHADRIARVTFWGLNDASSWRAESSPLVFDKNLQAKPAYAGVIDPDAFLAKHPPESKEANQAVAVPGTPVVDGKVDAVWSQTEAIPIRRYQTAWQGASGTARALWDDRNLYVLIQVNDAQLDKAGVNPWEQDSVEIFLDPNNGKTSYYEEDDGQYRVNFDNETSFNPPGIAEGFASAVAVSGTNYTVEAKIPLRSVKPAVGTKLGFDAQINDAKDGARQSVAAWNDTTGTGYMDPSVFGVLTLAGELKAPAGVTAQAAASNAIRLQWKNSEGAASYNVYRASSAKGPFVAVAEGLKTAAYTDLGLKPNTVYYYTVKASSGTRMSDSSAVASARTLLAPVARLSARALNRETIRLTWDAVPSARYTVYRMAPGGSYVRIADGLKASQYTDNRLKPAATYSYKVVAVTKTNTSEAASATATTKAK